MSLMKLTLVPNTLSVYLQTVMRYISIQKPHLLVHYSAKCSDCTGVQREGEALWG